MKTHQYTIGAFAALLLLALPPVAQEAEFEEVRIEVKPAYQTIQVVPAKYEWAAEKIMVKEAGPTTPAKFDTIRIRKVAEPATVRKVDVPAEYRTFKVLKAPKKTAKDPKKEPRFELRDSRFMVSPPVTRYEVIPAKFKTVTKQLMVKEATDKTPAEYKTYTRQELVEPAKVKEVQIPAEYRTFKQQVLVK